MEHAASARSRYTGVAALAYRDGYLKTSQALALAMGSMAQAIHAIENSTPGPHILGILKADQEAIRRLMA